MISNRTNLIAAVPKRRKIYARSHSQDGVSAKAGLAKRFRLLKSNELVYGGNFVTDGCQGFEPWDGLTGFRADAFVKPIYRRDKTEQS